MVWACWVVLSALMLLCAPWQGPDVQQRCTTSMLRVNAALICEPWHSAQGAPCGGQAGLGTAALLLPRVVLLTLLCGV